MYIKEEFSITGKDKKLKVWQPHPTKAKHVAAHEWVPPSLFPPQQSAPRKFKLGEIQLKPCTIQTVRDFLK